MTGYFLRVYADLTGFKDGQQSVGLHSDWPEKGKPSGTGWLFPVSVSDSESARPFLHLACLLPLIHPVRHTT